MVVYLLLFRQSGVTDHYAHNDEHALQIARSIISSLNYQVFFPLFSLAIYATTLIVLL